MKPGVDGFFVKHVDFDELLERIGVLLHLRWKHETPTPTVALQSTHGPLVVPAPEEVKELYRLARMGNMRSIRARAEELSVQDVRYARFAQVLSQLASRFQSRAIMELIAQYRVEGSEEGWS